MKLQWTVPASHPLSGLTLQFIPAKQAQWRQWKGSGSTFGEEIPVTQGREEGSREGLAGRQVKCVGGRQNQTIHEESIRSEQKLTVLSTFNYVEKKSQVDSRNCWRPGDINY